MNIKNITKLKPVDGMKLLTRMCKDIGEEKTEEILNELTRSIDPHDIHALYVMEIQKATLRITQLKPEQTIECLSKALLFARTPQETTASYIMMAHTYFRMMKNPKEAIRTAKEAQKANIENIDTLTDIFGVLYSGNEEMKKAIIEIINIARDHLKTTLIITAENSVKLSMLPEYRYAFKYNEIVPDDSRTNTSIINEIKKDIQTFKNEPFKVSFLTALLSYFQNDLEKFTKNIQIIIETDPALAFNLSILCRERHNKNYRKFKKVIADTMPETQPLLRATLYHILFLLEKQKNNHKNAVEYLKKVLKYLPQDKAILEDAHEMGII